MSDTSSTNTNDEPMLEVGDICVLHGTDFVTADKTVPAEGITYKVLTAQRGVKTGQITYVLISEHPQENGLRFKLNPVPHSEVMAVKPGTVFD